MPDRRRFRVRPQGIAYTEFQSGQPGRSVFVAETKASTPEVTGRSEVTYTDALSGGAGSIRYRVSISGLEQDLLLEGPLPKPSDFQMNEALVRVEVWNEILESPAPERQATAITRKDGSLDRDEELHFGTMLLGSGSAFLVDEAGNQNSVRVARQWQDAEGQVWLIESAPYSELKPLLAAVQGRAQARHIDHEQLERLSAASSARKRPLSLAAISSPPAEDDKWERMASARPGTSRREPALLWDWTLLTTATNFNFKGDTTWYCNGPVTLSATGTNATLIEGGTCVKFTNSTAAQITIVGPISCQSSPYRIAAFVSKDRDDVGEKITGSTGNPTGYYGAGLKISSATLSNLRFSDAETAITLNNSQALTLQDVQFVKCKIPLYAFGQTTVNLENALFFNIDALVQGGPLAVRGAHWSVDQCNVVGSGLFEPATIFLTNSILFSVTNWGFGFANRSLDTVETPNSFGATTDPNPFQTVGAGSHYLTYDTAFRDAGTTVLNAGLLERLARKTTYPPCVLISNFTVNTTFGPRDIRDVGAPDLGWHYESLDYAWSGLNLTNATLTLTNGVAVAGYGAKGTTLRTGAKFFSEGQVNNLNRLVRYNTVQEQANTNWTATSVSFISLIDINTSTPPEVRLKFTDASLLADGLGKRYLLLLGGSRANPFTLTHCQARGVYLDVYSTSGTGMTVALTNKIIQRSRMSFYQEAIPGYFPFTLSCYNNLFLTAIVTFDYRDNSVAWTAKDNLFDNVSLSDPNKSIANSNNGYSTNTTKLSGSSGGDRTVTNFDYQVSLLGNFYYPTNGTNLATLINAGSRTASSAGLDAYTTTTNQAADSGTVDIGYHFFAVNPNSTVTISATDTNCMEGTTPDPGIFTVSRTGSTSAALTVFYTIGGSAINGVDFTTLSGSVSVPTGQPSAVIVVTPINDTLIEPPESVTLTLILTNTYFVGTPDHATLTIQENDDLSAPGSVATLNAPIGIDYHSPTNSLIVSFNHPTGSPKNFRRIASNGAASDWSNLGGIGDPNGEIKLGIAQTTANGFTAGELFFGAARPGKIGRISADGSTVNTNWATLTNSTQMVGETNLLLGGFYIDRTAVFGGDLIVVTGSGGVWRVTAATNATKVAQINGASSGEGTVLEGVLTVSNDPCKYGPWAGKILSCAEHENLLCTIDTNGTVAAFDFSIGVPEDVDLVVTNQNLFCLNFVPTAPATSSVLKVPKTLLTNFVDDLLIVEENTATLVIVHWDGVRFVTRRLSVPGASSLEHVSFAPIEATP